MSSEDKKATSGLGGKKKTPSGDKPVRPKPDNPENEGIEETNMPTRSKTGPRGK